MIGRVVLAIVCHLAYLHIFTVILNAPAGVVAPIVTLSGKGAESVAHETFGVNSAHSKTQDLAKLGGDFSPSSPKGEDPLREATASTTNDVKISDEKTLLGLVEARRNNVIAEKQTMDPKGSRVYMNPDERPTPTGSLEGLAVTKTARKELRLEKSRFSFSNIYRMIFKRDQWKQDQLSRKLRNLNEISSTRAVQPEEAQLALKRLSILEYKGLEFSKEEGQLIENLSKQAKRGSSQDKVEFELSDVEKDLIKNMAWERVVQRKVQEITLKMKDLEQIVKSNQKFFELTGSSILEGYSGKILWALKDMKSILTHDSAQWSPETTRLLKKINRMRTGGDNPNLKLSGKDFETIRELRDTVYQISAEKNLERIASEAPKEVETGQDGGGVKSTSVPPHSH
ncbi:hypothetical protein MJO29_001413 [Puccinia striiformis f. sp. tritici]|nr:hypothetical protein Pst134EB_004414 [Puccinia striiformis f. sp. tritici]KAI7965665.1 hypothetical protein MJO29_001413 [Puccinia striiformis f. sp. tritici]